MSFRSHPDVFSGPSAPISSGREAAFYTALALVAIVIGASAAIFTMMGAM